MKKEHYWEIIRILEGSINGDTDKVKRYARRLASRYKGLGDSMFSESILAAIGDIETPLAVNENYGKN